MHSREKSEIKQAKKSYKTPGLVRYGQLKDLTTGGSGKNTEAGGKTEKNKKV